MTTMCIIISVIVAAVAFVGYVYVKLSKWTPELDASAAGDHLHSESTECEKSLPSRDSKGRFSKRQ